MELVAEQVDELTPSPEAPVEYAAPPEEQPTPSAYDDYEDDPDYEIIRVRRSDPYGSLKELTQTDERWRNIVVGLASRTVQQRATAAERELARIKSERQAQESTAFQQRIGGMTKEQFATEFAGNPQLRADYERQVIQRYQQQEQAKLQQDAIPPHVEEILGDIAQKMDAHQYVVPPQRMNEYRAFLASDEAREMKPHQLHARLEMSFEKDRQAVVDYRRQQRQQGQQPPAPQPAYQQSPQPEAPARQPVAATPQVIGNQNLARMQADPSQRRPSGINRGPQVYSQAQWDGLGPDGWQKQLDAWAVSGPVEAYQLGYIQR